MRSCVERVNKSMLSSELRRKDLETKKRDIGRRLGRGHTLLRKSVELMRKGFFETCALRARGERSESILNLCDSIVKRMQELQNSSETLQATKQKAFVDLLRAVKRLGISSLSSRVPKELRDGLRDVFELPEWDVEMGELLSDSKTLLWKSCELRFAACLARLQRLRVTAATEYSPDMNPNHVKRMLNHSNHIMYMMLQQRRVLTLIAQDTKELNNVCTLLRNGGTKEEVKPDSSKLRRVLHQTELLLSKRRGGSEQEQELMQMCRKTRAMLTLSETHLDKVRDAIRDVDSVPKCMLRVLSDEIENFRVTLFKKEEKKAYVELNESEVVNALDTVLENQMLASQTLAKLCVSQNNDDHDRENMYRQHQRMLTAYRALRSRRTCLSVSVSLISQITRIDVI